MIVGKSGRVSEEEAAYQRWRSIKNETTWGAALAANISDAKRNRHKQRRENKIKGAS